LISKASNSQLVKYVYTSGENITKRAKDLYYLEENDRKGFVCTLKNVHGEYI